jgi:hypothetical protein
MTVRIITPPPKAPVYRGRCNACRAEVEFDRADGSPSPDPRDSGDSVLSAPCPVPTCHGTVWGSAR